MNEETLKQILEHDISGHPDNDLPEKVFELVSQLTPLVNVDLLIKNKNKETLLVWRCDQYYGPGWHVPGGIIRFKEKIASRVKITSKKELSCKIVSISDKPIAFNELFAKNRDIRGHFISLLFDCVIDENCYYQHFDETKENLKHGDAMWHKTCPKNLIEQHHIYREFIKGI